MNFLITQPKYLAKQFSKATIYKIRKIAPYIGLIAAIILSGYLYWVHVDKRLLTVVDGSVYRSAQMPPHQVLETAQMYGVKTVVDFRKTLEDVAMERQVLQKNSIQSINVPSDIVPDEKTIRDFLRVMSDPSNYPILFHCEHGIGRSSLFEAIYRIEFLGWTNEKAQQSAYWRSLFGSFKKNDRRGQFLLNYKPLKQRDKSKFVPLGDQQVIENRH